MFIKRWKDFFVSFSDITSVDLRAILSRYALYIFNLQVFKVYILYYFPATTQIPDENAQVIFNTTFRDNYDATIKNMTAFIESYRKYFCVQTFKIDCARLTRPATSADVVKENSKFIIVSP